jgi:hypothetical protein
MSLHCASFLKLNSNLISKRRNFLRKLFPAFPVSFCENYYARLLQCGIHISLQNGGFSNVHPRCRNIRDWVAIYHDKQKRNFAMRSPKVVVAFALAASLVSGALVAKGSAAPVNGMAAISQQVAGEVQKVRLVCGPYRCWWRPGPYWGWRRWGWYRPGWRRWGYRRGREGLVKNFSQ